MMDHLLLVEGKDEKVLFDHLLSSHQMQGLVTVIACGGSRKFDEGLLAIKRQRSFRFTRTITAVRDADDSSAAAFDSVRNVFQAAQLPVPDSTNHWSAAAPYVQICIVPEHSPQGCIENLFIEAHRSNEEPIHRCLEALRQCWAPNQLNPARWAKIYTAIILRTIPGDFAPDLGLGIQKAEFNDLCNQEPLLQLTRILDRIEEKSNA